VHRDAGHTNGCASMSSVTYVGAFLEFTKGVFHRSAQIFVGVIATRSHSSLDNTPQNLSGVVRSGLCGGHGNGAGDGGEPRPIQRPGKCSFKTSRTGREKCAGAPSGCSHTLPTSRLSPS
jgi:hypothetical protein